MPLLGDKFSLKKPCRRVHKSMSESPQENTHNHEHISSELLSAMEDQLQYMIRANQLLSYHSNMSGLATRKCEQRVRFSDDSPQENIATNVPLVIEPTSTQSTSVSTQTDLPTEVNTPDRSSRFMGYYGIYGTWSRATQTETTLQTSRAVSTESNPVNKLVQTEVSDLPIAGSGELLECCSDTPSNAPEQINSRRAMELTTSIQRCIKELSAITITSMDAVTTASGKESTSEAPSTRVTSLHNQKKFTPTKSVRRPDVSPKIKSTITIVRPNASPKVDTAENNSASPKIDTAYLRDHHDDMPPIESTDSVNLQEDINEKNDNNMNLEECEYSNSEYTDFTSPIRQCSTVCEHDDAVRAILQRRRSLRNCNKDSKNDSSQLKRELCEEDAADKNSRSCSIYD